MFFFFFAVKKSLTIKSGELSKFTLLAREPVISSSEKYHFATEAKFHKPLPDYIKRQIINAPLIKPKTTDEELINMPEFKEIRDALYDPNGPMVHIKIFGTTSDPLILPMEPDESIEENIESESTSTSISTTIE